LTSSGLEIYEPDEEGHPVHKFCKSDAQKLKKIANRMGTGLTSSGLEICEPDEESHPIHKFCKPDEINPELIRFAFFLTFENRMGSHPVHKFTNRMAPPSPASDSHLISLL